MPSRRRSTMSPTRCCAARSAKCCRGSSAKAEKSLRVRYSDLLEDGLVEGRARERLQRARVAERERVVGADAELAITEGVEEEADRARVEDQLVVVEALRRHVGRFSERLLRLRKHVPRVNQARQQDGHHTAAVAERDPQV